MAALVEDYVRNCEVVRVIDGDTVVLDIDCGFRIWMRQTVRLLGVNCPEVKGKTWEAGERAKQFTLTWLHVAPFVVKTHLDKTDSFGRILAECWRGAASLTTALIESGHGVAYRAETEQ